MMNDPAVIQRLLFLVSFLASLSQCIVRLTRFDITALLPSEFHFTRQTMLLRSTLHPGNERKPSGGGAHKGDDSGTSSSKKRWSVAGDWLAPAIVWILVIMMGIAIVSFLLGQR